MINNFLLLLDFAILLIFYLIYINEKFNKEIEEEEKRNEREN